LEPPDFTSILKGLTRQKMDENWIQPEKDESSRKNVRVKRKRRRTHWKSTEPDSDEYYLRMTSTLVAIGILTFICGIFLFYYFFYFLKNQAPLY